MQFDDLSYQGRAFAYQGGDYGTVAYCSQAAAPVNEINEPLSLCSQGAYVSAVTVRRNAGPIVFMSAHVNPDKHHRANLKALVEKLSRDIMAGPIIIGGDFNACRHYDTVHKKNACGWFFKEMEEIGFWDCHFGIHGKEKRTYWSRRTSEPYQDDHFFVPAAWKDRVISCEVLPYDPSLRLSDHGPVELVL